MAGFERRALRMIYGAKFSSEEQQWRRRTREEIERLYGDPTVDRWIAQQRMKWAGHVYRSDDNALLKQALNLEVHNTRPRGRPRTRWKTVVERSLSVMNAPISAASNRDTWNQLCDLL